MMVKEEQKEEEGRGRGGIRGRRKGRGGSAKGRGGGRVSSGRGRGGRPLTRSRQKVNSDVTVAELVEPVPAVIPPARPQPSSRFTYEDKRRIRASQAEVSSARGVDSTMSPASSFSSPSSSPSSSSSSSSSAPTPSSTSSFSSPSKRHACHFPDCTKSFSKPSALKRHLRTHTGEKVTAHTPGLSLALSIVHCSTDSFHPFLTLCLSRSTAPGLAVLWPSLSSVISSVTCGCTVENGRTPVNGLGVVRGSVVVLTCSVT